MLIPNSRPARPQPAALAAADGSLAPPPQRIRSPSRSISARSPSSLIASPRNPSSATSKFEPEPITPTATPDSAAQPSSASNSFSRAGRAKKSAGPPVLTVVSRASGKSRSVPAGGSAGAPGSATVALRDEALRQHEDVASADRHQDLALAKTGPECPGSPIGIDQPPDRTP